MRWRLWATAVAAYAAELRLETFVTVELTLKNGTVTNARTNMLLFWLECG